MSESSCSPPENADVVVVGGGPIGCATAVAFARRGAKVVVLEANPAAKDRFAGEWLHPSVRRVFAELGLTVPHAALPHGPGRGFVVFPEDGSAPIVLPYQSPEGAFSCEHGLLVQHLRDAARATPHVTFVSEARAKHVEAGLVRAQVRGRPGEHTIHCHTVVGADGRASFVRRTLGLSSPELTYTRMAGVLLRDVELPYEQHGHVVLGGQGPILIYRIAHDAVRVCMDVPVDGNAPTPAYLWDAYGPAMPASLRPALREALLDRRVDWAVNRVRPKVGYGAPGVLLVGDAAGYYHPLTAVGMTLGFGDALAAAQSSGHAAYRRRRTLASRTAEMLAVALYDVFSQEAPDALAIRRAVYDLWRRNPKERARTIGYLAGEDRSVTRFSRTFLRATAKAASLAGDELRRTDRLARMRALGGGLAEQVAWLGAGMLHLRSPFPTRDYGVVNEEAA